MKISNKVLISLLIFFFITMLSKIVFGAEIIEIVKGETCSIEATDVHPDAKDIKGKGEVSGSSGIIKQNIHNETDPDYIAITGKKVGVINLTVTVELHQAGKNPKIEKTFTIKVIDSEDTSYISKKLKVGEKFKVYSTELDGSSVDMKEPTIESGNGIISYELNNTSNPDYVVITAIKKGNAKIKFTIELKGTSGTQTSRYYFFEVVESESGDSRGESTFVDVLDNIDDYAKPGELDEATSNKIGDMADKILTAITNIGMVIAVLMVAVLGIKYMLASVEEKAEYKKDAIPYFIGAILLFGILSFVKILIQWGELISNL